MTITVPMLDDLPSEDDEAQDCIRPTIYLPTRMLADAIPPAMARDLKRQRSIVAIIEVPSDDWMEIIRPVALGYFRPADFITRKEKLLKGKSNDQNLTLRSSMEVGHSLIALVTDPETQLSQEILASTDYRIRLSPPTNTQLAATLRAVFGNARIRKLPPNIGSRVQAAAILAAIRPAENAGRAVARLGKLDQRMQSTSRHIYVASDGPTLSELAGYGAAKDWGLALAQDLRAYRAGELDWAEISSAALLHGEPGTGKTLFASALARQCKIPIVSTSIGKLFATTDGYLNSVVKALDQAFNEAKAKAPSVLFLDEIDALPSRMARQGDRNDGYFHVVVTRLLKLLDDEREGVVVVAATNIFSQIDPAITRAGRIELHFEITPPTAAELVDVFNHYVGDRLSVAQLTSLADLACGSTGADVAFRTKNAIAEARRAGRELAFHDVASQFLGQGEDEETLRRIATHEAGHAVMAMALGRRVDHASTVSIGKRGGGVLAEAIGNIGTRSRIEDQVVILLAGRAAETLVLGEGSSGSHADLEAATNLVCSIHGSLGLGATIAQRAPLATAADALIDRGFRELVESELRSLDARCREILSKRLPQLDAIATALERKRALTGDELRKLFA